MLHVFFLIIQDNIFGMLAQQSLIYFFVPLTRHLQEV